MFCCDKCYDKFYIIRKKQIVCCKMVSEIFSNTWNIYNDDDFYTIYFLLKLLEVPERDERK